MSIKDEGWTITSSKSNKIRKGQWLCNALFTGDYKEFLDKLFHMSNQEFDKMMKDWEF